ncbi:MAG: aminodeoxychorismate synthase component I [Bacteroidota bacterium]
MYNDLPAHCSEFLLKHDNLVLLETLKYDDDNYRSFIFTEPVEVLQIFSPEEFPGLIKSIEDYRKNNYFAAGYFGYECGYHFENIAVIPTSARPIAWIGIYQTPIVFDHRSGLWQNAPGELINENYRDSTKRECYKLDNINLQIEADEYFRAIDRIKEFIRAGDTYQINFTTRYSFNFHGSPLSLFNELKKKQRVSYAAYLKSGNNSVVSLSPELFFTIQDNLITTKPMKGTARRGKTLEEDRIMEQWLANDPKNRAENLMIVDLLRNDIGRISKIGSVNVHDLFKVEKYDTLFQMTSQVEGELRSDASLPELLGSIFPSGSVTGAPKIRSMQIIHELEREPRGVYTGAIGYFSPNGDAAFNVAIRTLEINGNAGIMGVGGGIVYDSKAEDEYAECKLKAEFLTSSTPEFDLLETLLWDSSYPHLERHLKRLSDSCVYFGFPNDEELIRQKLLDASTNFIAPETYKVRLTLNASGILSIAYEKILPINNAEPGMITVSEIRTNSHDRFLYHKTTNRKLYDECYRKAEANSLTDLIFMNENGEITEGTRYNIFIGKNNRWYTPPVECGVLNGVYRQYLLDTKPDIQIKSLWLEDLKQADAIYLCNAVRALREVKLCV